jgi:hypothetical protein
MKMKNNSMKNHRIKANNSMKNIFTLYWLFPLSIVLMMSSGCASIIKVTKDTVNEVGIDNANKFQYYVSKRITLSLVAANTETTIQGGQLVRDSRTARNKITIRGRLPGVVRNLYTLPDNRGYGLRVAFEKRADQPTLSFGPYNDGVYRLLYTDSERNIVTYGDKRYRVNYNNKKHDGQPYLVIKMKQHHKRTAKWRIARGVKLGE